MHIGDMPNGSPVALWPTPWYLRFLGYKKWFYYKTDWLEEYPTGNVKINMRTVYVNSIHDIKAD